jgi:NADH-quinone oxidoreductase subunit H
MADAPLNLEQSTGKMPMERIGIPADRHYKVRVDHHMALSADPRKSGVINAVIGYFSLVVLAPLLILTLTFWGLPALLGVAGVLPNTFWYNLIFGLLGPVLAFLFIAVVALINILMLRKYLAKVQNRFGPLHHGPSGSLQTVFDALKLVAKEDHSPGMVEETIFTIAPVLVFVSAFLLMAVIPFAPGWVFANVDAGAIFIIAAGTLGSYGVLLAGWSMNNKYGLLGGLRAAAQLVSYEVPLSIALLAVCVYTGSMNLTEIADYQLVHGWNVFPLFIPFVIYLIAGLAEIKMTPFDLPEAESELVAGFNTEYGGMRFGFFFVAEFAELYLLPAVLAVFFLGGWHTLPLPDGFANNILGYKELFVWGNPADPAGNLLRNVIYAAISLLKAAAGVYFYMWIRATLPRFRDDQLMELCWKGLIPLSLVGLLLAAVSRLNPVIGAVISIITILGLLVFIVPPIFRKVDARQNTGPKGVPIRRRPNMAPNYRNINK